MQVFVAGFRAIFSRLSATDCGQSITEYALICALIACGTAAGYKGVAVAVSDVFNQISLTLVSALTPPAGN